jgi:predicted phage-related endonuclease|tara:strand:- start:4558 stop:5352 length:795 start_codon:yes stop_codon:yes gene_type:complete
MILQEKSPAWHNLRRKGIGGSDAPKIMAGDWLELWELKTGRRQPESLLAVLPVQMGVFTEPLNRAWFEQETGLHVYTEDCAGRVCPDADYMRANLDGRVSDEDIFEAKHLNAFTDFDDAVRKYWPQLQHNMAVTDTKGCYFSVFMGTLKYEWRRIERDDDYIKELVKREAAFWKHVEDDTAPGAQPQFEFQVHHDDMREVDMEGNNEWAYRAGQWLDHQNAADNFEGAKKGLKGLIEADVKLATGHGVVAKRAKNGAIRISEVK